ncbi:hypothetical protein N0O92_15340 [Alkalihalobacillus sp. MEB130]|uniref:hypothetical protein n=1 Tax=Alkalihalobacillus sp. MEB130 TaxID=2976704 RepID=UPI0028DE7A4C|nr:hypothetical protein [Alkalihalobacillus sp. MEB130]MDT8861591.1 hypothetical protein [Alkalihalobacillus sp. MEB130]
MMSLNNVTLATATKKLYKYKLKANIGLLNSLVFLQLIAVLFSLNGVGQMGTGGNGFSINVYYYSSTLVIAFTMLWAFIHSIFLTTKTFRYDDFTFVSNRIASNLSNMVFLATASLIAALFAMFTSPLLKVIAYFLLDHEVLLETGIFYSPTELLLGFAATTLYIFLFSALGYFVGTLIQLSKLFGILLPVIFFGTLFVEARAGQSNLLITMGTFIFTESSFLLFIIKVVCLSSLLFGSSLFLSNKLEVKQ